MTNRWLRVVPAFQMTDTSLTVGMDAGGGASGDGGADSGANLGGFVRHERGGATLHADQSATALRLRHLHSVSEQNQCFSRFLTRALPASP